MAASDQANIKLYWLEQSRAQNILWLLEELKVDYELELFHRNKQTMLAPPELKNIHPLGKSPVISVTPAGSDKGIVLAETGFIAQYLCEHFAHNSTMMPKRYKEGQEGKAGGETEQWLRWQYFLHYVEGSFMPNMIMALILFGLKSPRVPFLVRPLTSLVANQLFNLIVFPNAKTQLSFLENQLETSGGDYLCGEHLTAADVILSFGLISARDKFKEFGKWEAPPETLFPKLYAYMDRLVALPGYKRAADKIKEIDSTFSLDFKM